MDIAAAEIQAAPSFGTRVKVDYLVGMAELGKKFALLLDIDKILSGEDTMSLQEASANLGNNDNKAAAAGHA
jgi:purine-binding chemotaxis protein CheW